MKLPIRDAGVIKTCVRQIDTFKKVFLYIVPKTFLNKILFVWERPIFTGVYWDGM